MTYHQFKVPERPKKKAIALMEEALKLSEDFKVDKLNCKESWARQSCDMTPQEFFKLPNINWYFIYREQRGTMSNHYELGGQTMGGTGNTSREIDYFLWIRISDEDGAKLAEKHNLKLL
jgi:hypothetical protein